jgi:hypothetical protein
MVAEVMLALLLLTCRQPEKMGWVLRLWCRGMGHFTGHGTLPTAKVRPVGHYLFASRWGLWPRHRGGNQVLWVFWHIPAKKPSSLLQSMFFVPFCFPPYPKESVYCIFWYIWGIFMSLRCSLNVWLSTRRWQIRL